MEADLSKEQFPADSLDRSAEEGSREAFYASAGADSDVREVPALEGSRQLDEAQQLLQQKKEADAIELLENYLATKPTDAKALELLEEAHRLVKGTHVDWEGAEYFFAETATPSDSLAESARLEGWDQVEDLDSEEVITSDEQASLPLTDDWAKKGGSHKEQCIDESRFPETHRADHAHETEDLHLASHKMVNSWLCWRVFEEQSEQGETTLELHFFNSNPGSVTMRLVNVDYPPGSWPPGKTNYPWVEIERGQHHRIHRLRVSPGSYVYNVKVITVGPPTTKILAARLEVSVFDDELPKLVEVKCP